MNSWANHFFNIQTSLCFNPKVLNIIRLYFNDSLPVILSLFERVRTITLSPSKYFNFPTDFLPFSFKIKEESPNIRKELLMKWLCSLSKTLREAESSNNDFLFSIDAIIHFPLKKREEELCFKDELSFVEQLYRIIQDETKTKKKITIRFVFLSMRFLRLTRPVNLLVILLTGYVLHAQFLNFTRAGFEKKHFVDISFFLIMFSTVLIAAAGNIINDYFDVKIDRINKPEKLIVDRYIKKRTAILFHSLLNVLAVAIALIIGLKQEFYWGLIFHLITTFHLWMYSMILKRKFLIGNLVISVLTSMVPLLVYLFDENSYGFKKNIDHVNAFNLMAYFALFAFCTTLIREIQKDFADMKGDAMYGCKTVPLFLGLRKGRIMLFLIFGFTLTTFIVLFFMHAKLNVINIGFFTIILVLMLVSFAFSFTAIKRIHWLNAALVMKLVMVTALLFFGLKFYVG